MPKVQSSLKSKIVEICKKYPDYSREGEDLYRNVCAHKINFNHTLQSTSANVAKSHFESKKHQNLKNSGKIQETLPVVLNKTVTRTQGQKEFFTDLTEALVDADIPLFKLKNEKLRSFLVKYTKQTIPDESTLRKNYVTPLFESKLKSIANIIGDEDILNSRRNNGCEKKMCLKHVSWGIERKSNDSYAI